MASIKQEAHDNATPTGKRPAGNARADHNNLHDDDFGSQWHPDWEGSGARNNELPEAKRRRLQQISQLYHSLRGAVFGAIEARERKEEHERAISLQIAQQFPVQWPDEQLPASRPFTDKPKELELKAASSQELQEQGPLHAKTLTPTQSPRKGSACRSHDVQIHHRYARGAMVHDTHRQYCEKTRAVRHVQSVS